MKERTILFLMGLVIVSSCASNGYVPSYIISHTSDEAVEEQKTNDNEQEEIR